MPSIPPAPPATDRWPDLSGRIENNRHILPVRVYFEDTDFTGLVYHANYLKFCERGRSDYIRLLGIHHHDLFAGKTGDGSDGEDEQAAFVVRHLEIDYLRPAHIDDLLEIATEVHDIGKASLTLHQSVHRDETVLARLTVTVVLVNAQGRPKRIPKTLRTLIHLDAGATG